MKLSYSLRKRLVAYVLLLSLFLQSCFNPPMPPPRVPKGEEQGTVAVPTVKNNKRQEKIRAHAAKKSKQPANSESSDLQVLPDQPHPTHPMLFDSADGEEESPNTNLPSNL